MRDILVTAIVVGLLPGALFNPFVGVSLWTWLSVMNPHRLAWGCPCSGSCRPRR
jgi:hypothetical protein